MKKLKASDLSINIKEVRTGKTSRYTRRYNHSKDIYGKEGRIYCWTVYAAGSLLHDKLSRTEMIKLMREASRKFLKRDDIKLRWDRRAGCGCGCSPGFVIESDDFLNTEIFITFDTALKTK